MVAIIDYDAGNLRSVLNAMKRLGAECVVTSDADVIRSASHVLLPGVGEASSAMENLRQRGLDALIPTLTQPVLGICIGMQLMCRSSEEGNAKCMGIFDTDVAKLRADMAKGLKVPHMGWNTVFNVTGPLFEDIPDGSYFYFVHSFAPKHCADTCAETDYTERFTCALRKGNFFGTQFHPEKSGSVGEKLLSNFLKL